MSLGFNETTLVPQIEAIWEPGSHPHESTVLQKHYIFILEHCLLTRICPNLIFNRIYPNHNFETFLCCSPSSWTFDFTDSNQAFRRDFLYGSNTFLRTSEYTLPTQERSQTHKCANSLFTSSSLSELLPCVRLREEVAGSCNYCLDQLSLHSELQNPPPHFWHTDGNWNSTEPGCVRLDSKAEDNPTSLLSSGAFNHHSSLPIRLLNESYPMGGPQAT